ncbi:MAG: T9SS type A sorting domain-containing protein, partial [Armatimonadota bacterium]
AGRKGYSVWAPVGKDQVVYNPSRGKATTQEWEMADDLGDSHTSSLMQGGAIPASSTNFRTAGKVYAEAGKPVTFILYPQDATKSLFIGLYDAAGTSLATRNGIGTLTGTYTPTTTMWLTIKVRNDVSTNPSQKCWVNVSYTAPAVLANANTVMAVNSSSVWTGNSGTSEWRCAENWEDGLVPSDKSDVLIPANASPAPCVSGDQVIASLLVEENAELCLNGKLSVKGDFDTHGFFSGQGSIEHHGQKLVVGFPRKEFTIYPNPSNGEIHLIAPEGFDTGIPLSADLFDLQGRELMNITGKLDFIAALLSKKLEEGTAGTYFLHLSGTETQVIRITRN